MKYSTKHTLKDVLDSTLKRLNETLIEAESNSLFSYSIKTKGKVKSIELYKADTETKERLTLYRNQYIVSNPAEFLKKDIDDKLCAELLYNCVAFYCVNIELIARDQKAKKEREEAEAKAKETVENELNG